MSRVLATEKAKPSVQKMMQIVNGPLIDQINALHREGEILSDPNVWDGRLAQEFRNSWPEVNAALLRAKAQLEELRPKIQRITEDIMRAGGNF